MQKSPHQQAIETAAEHPVTVKDATAIPLYLALIGTVIWAAAFSAGYTIPAPVPAHHHITAVER